MWLTVALLFVGTVVYWRFLFGDSVLLYKDIGSDSLYSYYADFVQLSQYVRTQGFPSWSFYVGMGQDLAYATGYLIWEPVSWLSKQAIAKALIFQHFGKVLLVGLFFFRFLRLHQVCALAALLGSLLLSFSAYMCMGSCWFPMADEVVCFTALLLGAEATLQSRRWLLLALATALVGMINPFYLYLCAVLLTIYVPTRIIAEHGWQPRLLFQNCSALAAVATLGAGLGAVITLPYLNVVFDSVRGAGATVTKETLSSFPIFGFESANHYVTAVLRAFANDMVGVGDAYKGWQNYLEAPLTYCGLICLLIFPQALFGGSRRNRVIIFLLLTGIVIPTVFPWFRYLFWLFHGDYYRTYSLFWILGIITLSVIALSRYVAGFALNLWALAGTLLILLAILYSPVAELQQLINRDLRIWVTIYLFVYSGVLVVGEFVNRQKLAIYVLLAVASVELIQFDRITVADRKTVTKKELNDGLAQKAEIIAAVEDIKREENAGFFRLTKLRTSEKGTETDPNDSLVLGYYGTSSYGSFNSLNYIRFLKTVDALPTNLETDTRWAVGLAGNFLLSLFAGEKYVLVEDPIPFQRASQYELVRQYGTYYLFRNNLFVPLGLTFDHYMPEDRFRDLSTADKEQVLLGVAVLPRQTDAERLGLQPVTSSELAREMAQTSFPATIEKRRNGALKVTSFKHNRIEGTADLEQKSALVIQTPFDRGWRAFQDGQAIPTHQADAGLLGVILNAGRHKVELRFRNVLLVPGLIITASSLVLLIAVFLRWPRLHLVG